MERTARLLLVPVELIDRAEREDRLPPGSGLIAAFGCAFLFYAALIALLA